MVQFVEGLHLRFVDSANFSNGKFYTICAKTISGIIGKVIFPCFLFVSIADHLLCIALCVTII